MSISAEVLRINNALGAIKNHVSTLGVDTSGNIESLAQNITVLAKPNGNQGQVVGFTDNNEIGAVDLPSGSHLPSEQKSPLRYFTSRFLRFDPSNKRGLIIKAGTSIRLSNGEYADFENDTKVDLSTDISVSGADYFVYILDNKEIHAYTTRQSAGVYIGRFHTLCVDVGILNVYAPASPSSGFVVGNKYLLKSYSQTDEPDFYNFYNVDISEIKKNNYYDVITCRHPLSEFLAGDILPESIFCLTFRPECLIEDAMVFDKDTGICVDVYLQSGTGFNTRSAYNKVVTRNRHSVNHSEDMRMVGKRLLFNYEFTSASIGYYNYSFGLLKGDASNMVAGGHINRSNLRIISVIGCEDMVGCLWQWLNNVSSIGDTTSSIKGDGQADFGYEKGKLYGLVAGGAYDTPGGSRTCNGTFVTTTTSTYISSRGSCRVLRGS